MFEIDTKVEFKDPQARKWAPGVIVDEDNGFYEIEKPSGKVKKGIPADMVRQPGATKNKNSGEKWSVLSSGKGKTTVIKTANDPASIEFHRDLQRAYDWFNKRLFEDRLPGCFWTTIQKRSVLAHYKAKAWVQGRGGNGVRDEIMINPDYLPIIGLHDFLSSIVHEQVHQWQLHFGTVSRSGYHNEEFATEMERVGLQPSHTGEEGGRRTGQHMDHYIVPDGDFDVAMRTLESEGFELSWTGSVHRLHGVGTEYIAPIKGKDFISSVASLVGEGGGIGTKPVKKKSTRAKFVCPVDGCKESAMAKHSAKLMCGEHKETMKVS